MKKYILTIILVLLIVISIALNIFNKVKPISTEQTSTENTTKVEKSTININVYDAVHDKIEPKSVVIDNIKTVEYDDYVQAILDNSSFINENMCLLAVYKLESGDILIKLSEEFKDLSRSTLKGLQTSITKTLKEAYPDLGTITIQVDSND